MPLPPFASVSLFISQCTSQTCVSHFSILTNSESYPLISSQYRIPRQGWFLGDCLMFESYCSSALVVRSRTLSPGKCKVWDMCQGM